MRHLTLLVVLMVVLPLLHAQSVFKSGYIITNQNDTVNGLVDYRSEMRNMRVCKFKADEQSEAQTFLPGSIKGYRFTDGKFFISKYIETEAWSDTVFVEFLLKGISNLYYYNTTAYSAYFIEPHHGPIIELNDDDEIIEKNGVTYVKKNYRYQGQLIYAFKDCPEIRRDLEKARIGHKTLIEITKKYHDYMCDDEQCIVYEKEMPLLKVQLVPMVGIAISQFDTDHLTLNKFSFSTSYSMAGGLGFNFIIPRLNEKITLYANTQVTKDYFHGSYVESGHYYEDYFDAHIHNTRLMLETGLQYTYPKGRFRPFLAGGIYKDWSLKNEATLLQERVMGNVATAAEEEKIEGVNSNKFGFSGRIGSQYHLKKSIAFISIDYKYGLGISGLPKTRIEELTEKVTTFQLTTGLIF